MLIFVCIASKCMTFSSQSCPTELRAACFGPIIDALSVSGTRTHASRSYSPCRGSVRALQGTLSPLSIGMWWDCRWFFPWVLMWVFCRYFVWDRWRRWLLGRRFFQFWKECNLYFNYSFYEILTSCLFFIWNCIYC